MDNKIIDFDKSKEKLLNKKFPDIVKIPTDDDKFYFFECNKTIDEFKNIFLKYEDYLFDKKNNKEVKLDEVLVHFNRFFDAVYKSLSRFDDKRIKNFKEAMDYAMLSNGKRVRPFIMFLTYSFCKGDDYLLLAPFMVAIELIHTFSLIHDDLPCMDNDELRRGKPTVWKKYGEDIAVLVGDSLYMLAERILSDVVIEYMYTELASSIIMSSNLLTRFSGIDGMIGGQVYDVMNTGNTKLTIDDINFMYEKKTTALIEASILIGANLAPVSYSINTSLFEQLGLYIGEAYQIKDDLLEKESTTEKIGKSVNSDRDNNKITYVDKVGIEAAKHRLDLLYNESLKTIYSATLLLTSSTEVSSAAMYSRG